MDKEKIKKMLLVSLIIIALVFITVVVMNTIVNSVYQYAGADQIADNTYSGNWEKLKRAFTPQGLFVNVMSLFGKLIYLGMSSFGLFYYGIYVCVKNLKNRECKLWYRSFSFFVLAASFLQIGVCSVFTAYTVDYKRIDEVFYGRYDENILPILMLIGASYLLHCRKKLRNTLVIICSNFILMVGMVKYIEGYDLTNIHGGYFINGFSYLFSFMNYEGAYYFYYALIVLSVLMVMITFIFRVIKQNENKQWLLVVIILMEILLGELTSERTIYSYNRTAEDDIRLATYLEERLTEDNRLVTVTYEDQYNFIAGIQFAIPKQKIEIIPSENLNELKASDYVVLDGGVEELSYYEDLYSTKKTFRAYYLFYNE